MARRATPWETFITADNDVYLRIDPKLCAKDNYVMQPCKLWGFGLGDYKMLNRSDLDATDVDKTIIWNIEKHTDFIALETEMGANGAYLSHR